MNNRHRILIIDAEERFRRILSTILESCGYAVTVKACGADGLAAYIKAPYPLVITDVDIPDMTGVELLKQIKEGIIRELILLGLSIFLCIYCDHKQEKVERYRENEVEVIVNHLEPYKIMGEQSTFHLEEEFSIDAGKEKMPEIGFADIRDFDVSSEGSIYILSTRAKENFIFKESVIR